MGSGGRAFTVSLLAFLVFGVALASWHGDDAAQESVGGGGASGTSGESASTFTDPGESTVAANESEANETAADGNATAGDAP